MDASLLDVLHDGRDVRVLAVAERVDVDLDRVLEEAVDQDATRVLAWKAASTSCRVVAGAHRPAAEDVGRSHEHRVSDPLGATASPRCRCCHPPGPDSGCRALAERAEALPVLGRVDRLERRAEDGEPAALDRARQPSGSGRRTGSRRRPAVRARRPRAPPRPRAARSRAGRRCRSRSRRSRGCSSPSRPRSRARGSSGRRGRSSSRTRSPARSGSGPNRG